MIYDVSNHAAQHRISAGRAGTDVSTHVAAYVCVNKLSYCSLNFLYKNSGVSIMSDGIEGCHLDCRGQSQANENLERVTAVYTASKNQVLRNRGEKRDIPC